MGSAGLKITWESERQPLGHRRGLTGPLTDVVLNLSRVGLRSAGAFPVRRGLPGPLQEQRSGRRQWLPPTAWPDWSPGGGSFQIRFLSGARPTLHGRPRPPAWHGSPHGPAADEVRGTSTPKSRGPLPSHRVCFQVTVTASKSRHPLPGQRRPESGAGRPPSPLLRGQRTHP